MADSEDIPVPLPFPEGTDPVTWAGSFTASINPVAAVLLETRLVAGWFEGAIAAGRFDGQLAEVKLCDERIRHAGRALIRLAVMCAVILVAVTGTCAVLLAAHVVT